MGKVVYHWDDLNQTAFDNSPRLSAIAGADSFFYCIVNHDGKPVVAKGCLYTRKYHFFDKPLGYLSELMVEDDLLYSDFEKVTIAIRGVPFALIESGENIHGRALSRLRKVTDIQSSDKLYTDVDVNGICCAFVLPDLVSREANTWYSNATICHVISALIRKTLDIAVEHDEQIMLLNYAENLVEVVLCNRDQLLFANHYAVTAKEDILYYVLAVFRDLHIDALHVGVECTGSNADLLHGYLQSYLPRVGVFSVPDMSHRPDFPGSATVDLISVSQCAS